MAKATKTKTSKPKSRLKRGEAVVESKPYSFAFLAIFIAIALVVGGYYLWDFLKGDKDDDKTTKVPS